MQQRSESDAQESGARMGGVENAPQSLLTHMRVVLCGGEIGMTEKFLHRAEVRAAVEQMSGEGVAQRMGMRGRRCPTIEQTTNITWTETSTLLIEKDRIRR